MSIIEPNQIGIGEVAHNHLTRLLEEGYFAQMMDAYRFAIALALAHSVSPTKLTGSRKNFFSIATIDPDQSLYAAIKTIIDTGDTPVYRWAERLADWGVMEMSKQADSGTLDIGNLLKESEEIL